jgi:hypothetical protein
MWTRWQFEYLKLLQIGLKAPQILHRQLIPRRPAGTGLPQSSCVAGGNDSLPTVNIVSIFGVPAKIPSAGDTAFVFNIKMGHGKTVITPLT